MPTLMQQMVDAQEPSVRHAAVEAMRAFLRDDMDDLTYRKLWKGILAAFWLCDMAKVQQELATNVASLVHRFQDAGSAARWVGAFCTLVRRDWGRLDKYRLDKYYVLVRNVAEQCLAFAARRKWEPEATKVLMAALDEGLLRHQPNGLRLHYLDLVISAFAESGETAPRTAHAVGCVVAPCLRLLRDRDDCVFSRVMETVVRRISSDEASPDAYLLVQRHVYAAATAQLTPAVRRKDLYAALRDLVKLSNVPLAKTPPLADDEDQPAQSSTAPADEVEDPMQTDEEAADSDEDDGDADEEDDAFEEDGDEAPPLRAAARAPKPAAHRAAAAQRVAAPAATQKKPKFKTVMNAALAARGPAKSRGTKAKRVKSKSPSAYKKRTAPKRK
ncbi:nucleolar protein,Nop52-domain-containing protein [Pelagophyceae sp. CCMP2097]|nr:nucleolar protein,Nop52-domain-containing protein [Pelagophyceae sp. CCMP2097]